MLYITSHGLFILYLEVSNLFIPFPYFTHHPTLAKWHV